jgi:cobyrinic acid a,c-diamide synthase
LGRTPAWLVLEMPLLMPRIVIAALRGGSGKTVVSLGLITAWREMGYNIAPFKKGPDFIDAGWLSIAAGRPCHNLDPFLMNQGQILGSFHSNAEGADLSIIEGNRGLYDGMDIVGSCSTAELAKLLGAPVLLVLDVTMATRTVAAVVKGCQAFDPEINIAGVILNKVAGSRQEMLIRNAVERYCEIHVVGSLPKMRDNPFPERHMGLVPYQESTHEEKAISWARRAAKEYIDLDQIWGICQGAGNMEKRPGGKRAPSVVRTSDEPPRIGFIRDRAFWFYYQENLEQLERMGASLVEINSISQRSLPDLDALYIGGGFPETQAKALADNSIFRDRLREEINRGLPVYAECGGFMYLGEGIVVEEKHYPMVGALPVQFKIQKRPQGHGYTVLEVDGPNPYYPVGKTLKGHEFHYSEAILTSEGGIHFVFKVKRGNGINGERDGLCRKGVLATYTHVHAAGNDLWAKGLLQAAIGYAKSKKMRNCEKRY